MGHKSVVEKDSKKRQLAGQKKRRECLKKLIAEGVPCAAEYVLPEDKR